MLDHKRFYGTSKDISTTQAQQQLEQCSAMNYQIISKQPYVMRSEAAVNFRVSNHEDFNDKQLVQLVEEGCRAANVPVDHEELTIPALTGQAVIIASKDDGTPMGFIFFLHTVMPFTKRTAFVEQLLYVHENYRGSSLKVADGLLHMLERVAREDNVQDIFAGSSLNHNEAAKRVYERAGFKTTFAFKKDLT